MMLWSTISLKKSWFISLGLAFLLNSLSGPLALLAQDLAIGEWRTHLPYRPVHMVEYTPKGVYVAGSSSLFFYHKDLRSTTTITPLNGLSGVGYSAMVWDNQRQRLWLGYTDGTIDVLESGKVQTLSQIKNSTIVGDKNIYDLHYADGKIYAGTGFGVLVVDATSLQILDTWKPGTNGGNLKINRITVDSSKIFLASAQGLMEGDFVASNLADYRNWKKLGRSQGVPEREATIVVSHAGRVIVFFGDSIFYNSQGGNYAYGPYSDFGLRNLKVQGSYLLLTMYFKTLVMDASGQHILTYQSSGDAQTMSAAAFYPEDTTHFVTDRIRGLVKAQGGKAEFIVPNGPNFADAFRIYTGVRKALVVSGAWTVIQAPSYRRLGIYWYRDGFWNNMDEISEPNWQFSDPVCGAEVGPDDFWIGTFVHGLVRVKNGLVTQTFNQDNMASHTLKKTQGDTTRIGISDMVLDGSGRLWMANFGSPSPVSVLDAQGNWQAPVLSHLVGPQRTGRMLIDQWGQKWVAMPGNGILVFDEKRKDGQGRILGKLLTSASGQGGLPNQNVHCLVEDKNGAIWVGTDAGPAVFYSPGSVLSGNVDAQQIRLVEDGFIQILLENETITSMAVDGANRKWMSTRNGVWLFSPDGQKALHHFTTANSPLLNDRVGDVAIDPVTGEVWLATESGLMSYRSTATEAPAELTKLKVYPNPVPVGYRGTIAMDGMAYNADVRITDASGQIVWHTKAHGGQAVWDGRDFYGQDVPGGVYLIFSTADEEGTAISGQVAIIRNRP